MYELIKKYEGFRDKAYKCPAGVWTIGYGSTFYKDGRCVSSNDTITEKDADELLKWYCDKIKLPKGNWSDNQKEALYSLIYNIGQGAFDRSNCKKHLESCEWQKAWKNWDWNKCKGEVLESLEKRRKEERKIFFNEIILDIPF